MRQTRPKRTRACTVLPCAVSTARAMQAQTSDGSAGSADSVMLTLRPSACAVCWLKPTACLPLIKIGAKVDPTGRGREHSDSSSEPVCWQRTVDQRIHLRC